ncbi:MAG: DUF2380 domain-containing protein [Gemmatimonadota bacterium]|nr:DUF2380 domain-containing protein [Gemmatimonadota bacterium]
MRYRTPIIVLALSLTVSAAPTICLAQATSRAPLERPAARALLLPMAMYNEQANLLEATDTVKAFIASEVVQHRLGELLGAQLVDSAMASRVLALPAVLATTGGKPCNVIVACARAAAREAGAPWVVMGKVSKTSNLIWLFTGQLIHVASGEIILDDSTELKGDPDNMVRVGSRIFAERVARAIRLGGVATNYPDPNWPPPTR